MKLDEKALEAAVQVIHAAKHVYNDKDLASNTIRAYLEAATPPDVAELLRGLRVEGEERNDYCPWAVKLKAATALRLSAGGEAQPVGYANLYRDEDGGYRLGGIDVYPQPEPEWGEFSDDFLGPAAIVPLHALPASPTVEAGHVE